MKNLQTDGNRQFLTMHCPPYGHLRVFLDDGEAMGEEWNADKTKCMNWIQDNWQTLWPIVEGKLNEMAARYAYGEKNLEPHLMNPRNSLIIDSSDQHHWGISLEIRLEHGGHAFCIDLNRDQVTDYQPVY